MIPDPWATGSRPSASENQTMNNALSEMSSFAPLNQGAFVLRGARTRSTTRAQDTAAMLEDTLSLFVEATGKDESSMRQQLVSKRPEELRRSREHWRLRAEEKQRFQGMQEEAWELFRRQPGHKQTAKEKFAQEFERRVMNMVEGPAGSKVKEIYLHLWMNELQK